MDVTALTKLSWDTFALTGSTQFSCTVHGEH